MSTSQLRPLAVRFIDDALADPPPERPVLVEGLIRQGEKVVVGAPRAVGKSWLAMNLACLLGRGEGKFLGQLTVREKARVLISQGELDTWATPRRWRKLVGSLGPPPGVAETFDHWRIKVVRKRSSQRMRDGSGSVTDSEDWTDAIVDPRFEETITANAFDVVIFDPWRVYFGGEESSNDQVEAALRQLDRLIRDYGISVVLLHHMGKSRDGAEPEDLWRGASRLADWASTRVTLMPHYSESQARRQNMTRAQGRCFVDVTFLRRAEPTEDFSARLDPETGWWQHWNSPPRVAEARRKHVDPEEVHAACDKAGGWLSIKRAAADLGLSQELTERALSRATTEGFLEEYPGPRGARSFRVRPFDPWAAVP